MTKACAPQRALERARLPEAEEIRRIGGRHECIMFREYFADDPHRIDLLLRAPYGHGNDPAGNQDSVHLGERALRIRHEHEAKS